jgi:hypothetical protein
MSKDSEGFYFLLTFSKDFLAGYELLFPFFAESRRPYALSASEILPLENAGRFDCRTGYHDRSNE